MGLVPPQSGEEKVKTVCLVITFIWYLHVVNHRRPSMIWLCFVRFNATLKMFWRLRPQCVSSSFTQQDLPKQSLSHISVPLGLALFLVNLFDFLIGVPVRADTIPHNGLALTLTFRSMAIWCNLSLFYCCHPGTPWSSSETSTRFWGQLASRVGDWQWLIH